jgi:hypothetical protein
MPPTVATSVRSRRTDILWRMPCWMPVGSVLPMPFLLFVCFALPWCTSRARELGVCGPPDLPCLTALRPTRADARLGLRQVSPRMSRAWENVPCREHNTPLVAPAALVLCCSQVQPPKVENTRSTLAALYSRRIGSYARYPGTSTYATMSLMLVKPNKTTTNQAQPEHNQNRSYCIQE